MFKILQREEWVTEIEKVRPLMMNEELAVVNILCNYTHSTPQYFLYQKKDKTVISFIAFVKGTDIIAPFHFFYSAFWIHETISNLKYIEYLTDFVGRIIKEYSKINIRLPIVYQDIRPFLWNDFTVINNYTYLKKLENLNYSAGVRRNIEKCNNIDDLCFKQEALSGESLQLNLKIFKELGVLPQKVIKIKRIIEDMTYTGHLNSFNCYCKGKLSASMIVLKDKPNKIAYLILLSQTRIAYKNNMHSALHHFMFTMLNNDGFETLDLMGGDIKTISAYKASLNTDLRAHFTLKYDRSCSIIKKVMNLPVKSVRKIISKFM